MVKIQLNTEQVRDVGCRVLTESAEIAETGRALYHAIDSLDTWAWDGRSRANAEPLLEQVRPQSGRLAEELERLGRLLQHVADRFENEDSTAARELEGMPWVEGFQSSGISLAAAGLSSAMDMRFRIIDLFPRKPRWRWWRRWIRRPWDWWRPYPWPPRYWPVVPIGRILPIPPRIIWPRPRPWLPWPRPGIPGPILPPGLFPRPLPRPLPDRPEFYFYANSGTKSEL